MVQYPVRRKWPGGKGLTPSRELLVLHLPDYMAKRLDYSSHVHRHRRVCLPLDGGTLGMTCSQPISFMFVGLPQPLLEVNEHPMFKTTLERMQRFFGILYENW